MPPYFLPLSQLNKTHISLAGGKGANLGELMQIAGIAVPEGFCVTTEAYQTITGNKPELHQLLDTLMQLKPDEREAIRKLSATIRNTIENLPVPETLQTELATYLDRTGAQNAYAVRSSATAEDLPAASFAGQQDTFLNVTGTDSILRHIRRCWASLFTERAVSYRIQNGFDHRKVQLAVVVQQMVFPQASGILFTADPVTGNRKTVSIDAGFGLGEALVSGLVNADHYKVYQGAITDKSIAVKKRAVYAPVEGGTQQQELGLELQNQQTLTDAQILELARLGRTIEAHFGCPQDIEWCLADETFYIVQSRPVTTLFPIPDAGDSENRVYISVGHNQMMTDAMKPLGLSFFLLTTRAPMRTAGGRLFVDVTHLLATPSGRKQLIDNFSQSDPLIQDALIHIAERTGFIRQRPDDSSSPIAKATPAANAGPDPAMIPELMQRTQDSLNTLKRDIETKSGTALFDFIQQDLQELRSILFNPEGGALIQAGMEATAWINEHMKAWLGEQNAADALVQSVPNNITSEMGLALLDVADAIRPYPEVVAYLQATDTNFPDALPRYQGGLQARDAILAWLNKYGMRCVGEIDISKTRWSEQPALLIPLILSHIKNFEAGESRRRFEQGLQQAQHKEQELLERLSQLPDGAQKAAEAKQMISRIRNFMGFREFPKYGMVSRYFIYKQALLQEADRMVQAGVLQDANDIFYLSFEELHEAVRTQYADQQLIRKRKEAFLHFEQLKPPRVMTSEGEIITGRYRHEDLPAGALAGLGVSSGTIEGRARVILDMADAELEEGDILVTAFTDPSWTPLFVSVKALVTEVGGMMTHGAVIAREYGLPAVVGVEQATKRIRDGQRIRVHGREGYVELL